MKPSNYREKNAMAYTRKEYIGGIPGSKIVKFTMGNTSRGFTHKVKIVATKAGQIRHNALEAARVAALRHLENGLGLSNFLLKIVPYPHQILREHKRLNVAQADRFQEGMKLVYGKPIGVAARLKNRATVMFTQVDAVNVEAAKEALRKASNKLPIRMKMITEVN